MLPNTGRSRSAPDDVHVVLTGISTGCGAAGRGDRPCASGVSERPGITPIWRQDCYALPTETEPFGFKDGISHPAIEGSGIPGTNPHEVPLKPGEFVLGYTDEYGGVSAVPATGRSWAATAATSRFESCTSASPHFAATSRRTRRMPMTRSSWRQR